MVSKYEPGALAWNAAQEPGLNDSMTAHALQAAYFAQQDGAPAQLVLAALLHDIGHLVQDAPADIADWTVDARHEEIGSRWLARRFGPEIAGPVRLHVPAKRYLCATDPMYLAKLSQASVHTLKLQGGPMSHNTDDIPTHRSDAYGKG